MESLELIVRSHAIVSTGGVFDGWIGIRDGKIVGLGQGDPSGLGHVPIADLTPYTVLPGLIDTHVHIREPGHEEREDFLTGSATAAAGGITTILEMPISVPPSWNREIFERRVALVKNRSYVDIGFYAAGGVQALPHIHELAEAGAVGYKIFLHRPQSGREHEFEGLWAVDTGDLYQAFQAISRTGLKVSVHAEDDDLLRFWEKTLMGQHRCDPAAHTQGHPVLAEVLAIQRAVSLAKDTGARLNISHLSSGSGADIVRRAKAAGVDVTAETCPHYLYRCAKDMDRLGPYAKINPPLRTEQEQRRLWTAVRDGTVDFFGSDHAPYTVKEKERGQPCIWHAPAGAPGLETLLPVLLRAIAGGQLSWPMLARLTAFKAAQEFGLTQKGAIAPGKDADLAVVQMRPTTISRHAMLTRSRESALLFDGETTPGRVVRTYVRGHLVYDGQNPVGSPPPGMVVRPARMAG